MDTEHTPLLPCPFCNKSKWVRINQYDGPGVPGFVAQCDASGFAGERGCGASTGWYETEEEAVSGWNTRHSVNLLPDLLEGLRMARKQLVYWGDPAAVDTIDALIAKATS